MADELEEHWREDARRSDALIGDATIRELLLIANDPEVGRTDRIGAWRGVKTWLKHRARYSGTIAPVGTGPVTLEGIDAAIQQLENELESQ
jgi:hypothetical protein